MSKENPPSTDEQSQSSFDFRIFTYTLLEKSWVILICLAAAAFWTLGYLQRAPILFSSTATLQVEQDDEKVVNIQAIRQEDTRSQEVLRTIEQNLQSRAILERTVDLAKLGEDARFVSTQGERPSRESLAGALAGMVTVRLRRGTRLIDVLVVHTNAQITAKVANAIVQAYMEENYEQYTNMSSRGNSFLTTEQDRLAKKLHASEIALDEYKKKSGTISLDEKLDVVAPKLKELSQRYTDAQNSLIKLETEFAQLQKMGTNDLAKMMVLSLTSNDREVMEAQGNLTKVEADFIALKQRYKEKHPKYIQANTQVEEYRKSFTNAVLRVPHTAQAALESARINAEALKKAMQEQEAVAQDLSKQAIQYNVLKREVETDQKLYEGILTRLKETGLTQKLYSEKIRVVQPAFAASSPFSPNRSRILTQGLLAGLVGGILLVLFINSLDTSLKTVDQAEHYLQLPVLSAIPQIKEVKGGKGAIVVSEDAKSMGAEAFRSLRTSLSMLGREEERKVFLFTSAIPQEGKTFCSVNYSGCLAQQGLKTLLIDCDLRRPAVELALLGKKTKNVGVTDYLIGTKKLNEIIQPTFLENFFYIPAGTTAPNPAELLAQGGFNGLLDEACLQFDRVVVDSAPVHAVSDTLMVLDRVQTVCIVVRANKTSRKGVARAIKMLHGAGAPVAGVLLNRLPRRRGRGYYYDPYYDYSYHSSYGEKGVYGA